MEEMLELVNQRNGLQRIFVSVYNYTGNETVDAQNLDVDKIFLDIDHEEKCFEDIKILHEWLMKKSYKHLVLFSGFGFHCYILCSHYEKLKNKKNTLYNATHFIADELDFNIGSPKVSDLDEHVVGDLARIVTFPGTYNIKRKKFCTSVTDYDFEKGYEYIREKAKKPSLYFKWYGQEKFDISRFDTERPNNYTPLELTEDVKLVIQKDDFLKGLPLCVAGMLQLPHIGYKKRGYVIEFFRDKGYLLSETISILNTNLKDRAEFIHCVTKQIAPGYNSPGEEQPQYLYKDRVRNRTTFPSCEKLKEEGLCPVGTEKCEKWKIYD